MKKNSIQSLSLLALVFAILFTSCSTSNLSVGTIRVKNRQQDNTKYEVAAKNQTGNIVFTAVQPKFKNKVSPQVADNNVALPISFAVATHKTSTPVNKVSVNVVNKVKQVLTSNKQMQVKQATHSSASSSKRRSPGGKSQLVALLLCIFLGGLGIHRFYLGYIGIGIIQLLTAGGCGIWALIDLIRIITGDLKPKGGDYESKL